jgi:hypothetical protein
MVLRTVKIAAGALLTIAQLIAVVALWSNDAPQFIYVAF